ncbi:hypothetical protein M9H77_13245 [Catharanthus roseus]|uniref:Uncharacterized protein n=1 Tax=Catharanthus roseus TaxID=4058 RepID=A0ACC0BJV4_CATRO|nr:hypothetical protein M9H77_13245 [Catharanthus roseus]
MKALKIQGEPSKFTHNLYSIKKECSREQVRGEKCLSIGSRRPITDGRPYLSSPVVWAYINPLRVRNLPELVSSDLVVSLCLSSFWLMINLGCGLSSIDYIL